MSRIITSLIPLNKDKTLEDLVSSTRIWVAGSPHVYITKADLRGLERDEFRYNQNGVIIETERVDLPERKVWAMRYVLDYGNVSYKTEIVGEKTSKILRASVINEYESRVAGYIREEIKKPRIINDAIQNLGGGIDGTSLKVSTIPFVINPQDLPFVTEMLNNKTGNTLPIIYLSRDKMGDLTLSAEDLARRVSGMAHVLVEPSIDFSYNLGKDMKKQRHVFGGFSGIYWPNGWVDRVANTGPDMINKLYEIIRQRAVDMSLPKEMTFSGVLDLKKEIKLRKTLQEMEDSVKSKVESERIGLEKSLEDRALQMAMELLEDKAKEIEQLHKNYSKQLAEAHEKLSRGNEEEQGVLVVPAMRELYKGEIRDMVIDSLQKSLDNSTFSDSRRADILRRILTQNPTSEDADRIGTEVKRILQNLPTEEVSEKVLQELRSLGLVVEKGGKHYHIYVRGYENRKITLACTPSDYRTGKNTASNLIRTLL